MRLSRGIVGLATVAAIAWGCAEAPLGRLVVMRSIFGTPSLSPQGVKDARLFVTVIDRFKPEGYRTQNVGAISGSYTQAVLTLSGGGLASNQSRTISVTGTSYTAAFTGLRPNNGYNLAVSLRNGSDVQVGNADRRGFALSAGNNSITVIVSADGSLNVGTNTSTVNSVTSNTFVRGDNVNFNTGFASGEANVASMSMIFSNGFYDANGDGNFRNDGDSMVAAASSAFNAISMNTGASSSVYNAALLVSPADTATGTVTFRLFNTSDIEIGRTSMPATVSAGAQVDLQLQ